jgi:predicted O-methyltransferase YrrM
VDLHPLAHRDFLTFIAPPLMSDWDYPMTRPEGWQPPAFYEQNDAFMSADARALFVMLRRLAPRRMIEVGSGFSTFLTADVNRRFLGGAMHFTVVEPYREDLAFECIAGVHAVRRTEVQDVPLEVFAALEANDVLFIDGSHVAKTGSDVVHLALEILPRLQPGVVVHFHDVFLPNEYPRSWVLERGMHWNEQYVVQALLQGSAAFEVLYGSAIAHALYPEAHRAFTGGTGTGGSLWLRRRGVA